MTKPACHEKGRWAPRSSGLKWAGVFLITGMLSCTLALSQRQKKPPAPPDYALVTGSVFNPKGALIPNVTVEVHPVNGSHHWETMTDEMGEFYVRVPPGKMDYRVRASAPGYAPNQQIVHVVANERETIFLHLTPKQ